MCGIAGIFNFKERVDRTKVEAMITAIAHRGPDGGNTWVSPNGALCLGHRRLSIIDLSLDAFQPMHYLENRYTIVFNGEIYNYIELKEELKLKGYYFKTSSDTEVLLALYHDKKEKCLDLIDGMFAFAIYDNLEQSLFCARDRFGEKPFYYSIVDGVLYFASEMKALWAGGVPKIQNREQYYLFFQYDLIRNLNKPTNTFYENIYLLENANILKVDKSGQIVISKYWSIDLSKNSKLSFDKQKEIFLELFTNSIKRRLRSDVPVGSSLSGGLDSSSIVMMIDKIKEKDQIQKTFSARFENFSKDEGKYIKHVTDAAKVTSFHTWPDELKLIENFEKLCFHQEEPFSSSSIFAQWEVMKLAKENNVTVLLDGQGADEIAAGYDFYFTNYYARLYFENKKLYNEEIDYFNKFYNKKFNLSLVEKIKTLSPWIFNTYKRSFFSKTIKINKILDHNFYNENNKVQYPMIFFNDLNKNLNYSTNIYGLHELLRFSDRNSMAFSREVRLPFLEFKLVEFLFSLPPSSKICNGISKYIIRDAMKGIVPNAILERKEKIGYEPPQKTWLRSNHMKDLINSSVQKLESDKIIKKKLFINNDKDVWKILVAGQFF